MGVVVRLAVFLTRDGHGRYQLLQGDALEIYMDSEMNRPSPIGCLWPTVFLTRGKPVGLTKFWEFPRLQLVWRV